MNRDERTSRAPADPPRLWRLGSVTALAPRDGEAGGTWTGVNDHGLSVALANVYPDPSAPAPPVRISRGRLVLDALGCETRAQARELLQTRSLSAFEPFHLIVFTPGDDPWGARWDGRSSDEIRHRAPGLVATSSPEDPEGTERIRRGLFAAAAEAEGGFTGSVLDALHRSHGPEAGPYAISMQRANAATVSSSTIRVSPDRVTFVYVPGPPHETPADPPLTLRRVPNRAETERPADSV